jgi:hypothetical protein
MIAPDMHLLLFVSCVLYTLLFEFDMMFRRLCNRTFFFHKPLFHNPLLLQNRYYSSFFPCWRARPRRGQSHFLLDTTVHRFFLMTHGMLWHMNPLDYI